jgi:protein-disulfide isomerase
LVNRVYKGIQVATHVTSNPSLPEEATVALAATEHSIGNASAPLTLLEYGDYECPACAEAEPAIERLLNIFPEELRFVFRHFPLVEIHLNAELAAEAAEAAAAQGHFWEMHRLLLKKTHHLREADLVDYAEVLELDMNRFKGEMADRIYTQRVQEHRAAGKHIGIKSTPTFYLNNTFIDVSSSLRALDIAVHAALAHRKIPRGT